MEIVSTQLAFFISKFNLTSNHGQVCFDGVINFNYDGKEIQLESKVIIVNSVQQSHDTVFILSTKLIAIKWPEVFKTNKDEISYSEEGILKIKGTDVCMKPYTVLIFPLMHDSDQ